MLTIFNSFFESQFNFFRKNITRGTPVLITLKEDQRTQFLVYGFVDRPLTSKPRHTRGIKVRLLDGQVGRVQYILNDHLKTLLFNKILLTDVSNYLSSVSMISIIKDQSDAKDYIVGDIVLTNTSNFMKILSITSYKNISEYPTSNNLSEESKQLYLNKPFSIIVLEKIGITR